MNDLDRWLITTTGIVSRKYVSWKDMRAAAVKVRPSDARAWDGAVADAINGLHYSVSEAICKWHKNHPTPKRGKTHAEKIIQAYDEIRKQTA